VAFSVEVVGVHVIIPPEVVPLAVPIPRPTAAIDEGLRLASVTLTLPTRVTVKVKMLDPFGSIVPEKVSFGFSVAVGVGVPEF
jgi:hypothetical protein